MIQARNYAMDEEDDEEAAKNPPAPPISPEEVIARQALAETYSDPTLTRMIEDAARHQARLALRKELKAFAPDHPPSRPVDPKLAALSPLTGTPVALLHRARPRTQDEKRQATREFWEKAFLEQSLTLDDLHPYRVRVFYRLLREAVRLFDLLQPHELLEEIPSRLDGTSPWTLPRSAPARPLRGQQVVSLMNGKKTSLYPSSSETQESLALYLAIFGSIAAYLGIEHGTELEPHLGRYGLRGLLDPALCRLTIPAPQEVFLWERVLVSDTCRCVVTRGVQGAQTWLQKTHGLDHVESADLIKQAKAHAKKSLNSDTEEERAVMILRLEDFARRAKRGLSLAGELGAYKQLSIVMGFGRIEPEDAVSEFVATVRRVNAEKKAVEDPPLALDNET